MPLGKLPLFEPICEHSVSLYLAGFAKMKLPKWLPVEILSKACEPPNENTLYIYCEGGLSKTPEPPNELGLIQNIAYTKKDYRQEGGSIKVFPNESPRFKIYLIT